MPFSAFQVTLVAVDLSHFFPASLGRFSVDQVIRVSMNKREKDMKKNTVESQRVGKLVRAKTHQCYLNAFRVIQNVPEYADADYVEGMALFDFFPIEHGWVEKDGVVIDPTLPLDQGVYFPGLRFQGQRGLADALQIRKRYRTAEDLPIFYRFGWGGIDSPEFRAALIAAWRHFGDEKMAKQYEDYQPLCNRKNSNRCGDEKCRELTT